MSDPAPLSIAVVCEARVDCETACGLVDRVIAASRPQAVGDEGSQLPSLDGLRRYRGETTDEEFVTWMQVSARARSSGWRHKAHGHFAGEPGAADALAARRALLLLLQAPDGKAPRAVMLIRDSDNDPMRRVGLNQARDAKPWPFTVLVGLAHPKREAWVLAGFEPREKREESALSELREELGFDPRTRADKLTAARKGARRNAKRVLHRLTDGDEERERRCWTAAPLDLLHKRGTLTGLADFLAEVDQRLGPLLQDSSG